MGENMLRAIYSLVLILALLITMLYLCKMIN